MQYVYERHDDWWYIRVIRDGRILMHVFSKQSLELALRECDAWVATDRF